MGEIFDLEDVTGLSDDDAAIRLQEEGYNELPSQKKRSASEFGFGSVCA